MAETIRKLPWLRIGAETIAIVISILLAFSIDAWYERRGERALEAEYLQRINDELKAARVDLEAILYEAQGNRLFVDDLAEFFDGRMAESDHQRLIVAIYKFGLDPLIRFDVSTFDDLVSTGRLNLISDIEVRQSIQRAYSELQRVELIRDPYRDEYKFALSGLISRPVGQQIRDACPDYKPYSACSNLHLDENTVRSIVEQIDTREALIAVNIRHTGLGVINGLGEVY